MGVVRHFEARADTIGAIRGFVQQSLLRHGAGDEAIDAAVLCASELATNALLHGEGAICVEVDLGTQARVSVRDSNDDRPVPREAAPEDDNGRGLLLVSLFADRWGWSPEVDGKTVWFEIGLDGRRQAEAVVAPGRRWGRRSSDTADATARGR